MIVLDTVGPEAEQDITGDGVDVVFDIMPSSPAQHKIMLRIELAYIDLVATRNLHLVLTDTGEEGWFYNAYLEVEAAGSEQDNTVVVVGPFLVNGGMTLKLVMSSDNGDDDSVTYRVYMLSDDLEYYLTWRAAETSPTANSPTERIKAIDNKLPSSSYLLGSSSTSGQINAAAFATDAIAAAAVKADAVTKIQAGLATSAVQTTNATHLTDIKGTGFVKDTDSLVNLGHIGADSDTLEDLSDEIATVLAAVGASSTANLLQTTTIATLASQTSFTLTAGSADDDAYNTMMIIVTDSGTAAQKAVGYIADYTVTDAGATKTVTLSADPAVFTMAVGDTVNIVAFPNVTGGTGENLCTITIDDGSDPINGVTCWITTDSAGTNAIKSGTTNASGIITNKPHLTDGTYYLWLSNSGYDATNSPETLTVAGAAGAYAETFSMTAVTGGGGTDSGFLEFDASDVMTYVKAYLGGTVTDATAMKHVVAGAWNVYTPLDPRSGRRHHWSFLQPEDSIVLWKTATGTASVSTTTITDATNCPFYETMVGHTLVMDTSETEYTITGYTSSSVITVSADATADNGDTFTITPDGRYYLPARYRGIKSRPVYAYDSSDGNRHRLTEVSPETIYARWRHTNDAGLTRWYAVVADDHDTSTTQKYILLVAPVPEYDWTVNCRWVQRIPDPAVNLHFLGGPTISMAIRDAALADAEIVSGDTTGVWAKKASESLATAIDEDKETIRTSDTEHVRRG